MEHRSYEHVAMLLLLMRKRSGKARIRLSQKSIQEISGRSTIRAALIDHINQWLEPEATLIKLNGGGYTLVAQSALEGVPPLKIGDIVPNWKSLKVNDIENELEQESED